jgi:putative heme-binding domain-containing protein
MWRLVPIAGLVLAFAATPVSGDQPLPQWIWGSGAAGKNQQFAKQFHADAIPPTAKLRLAADFCHASVLVNSKRVLSIEPYCQATEIDVSRHLRSGDNKLEIEATPVPGPAAVALSLELASSKQTDWIVTDAAWSGAASLGLVAPEQWGAGRRSIALDTLENYEQWRQATSESKTDPAKFWIAPGFEISLLRTALPDEGSWVSMALDPAGRLTIAREDQGLLRMTLDEARKAIAKVETINRDLKECRGLLYAHGSLYASANNAKGLYRLQDRDGDGELDESKLLRELPGGVGHGRNDLTLGLDGSIYWICGDSVEIPTKDILDRTSPFREARRDKKTSEGFLLKTDTNGQQWELICGGLRNPFGVAFNQVGDAFTYDADAEFDMGTPWYRPTRVVQLVSGGDYAWRGVTGQWPPYFPDHAGRTPATLDIGKGSPTAVEFGTKSSFPAPYRDALFMLDWTYGRVLAVHLAPRGAGYRAAAETFLQGRPLNVTDLAFSPDGAMYLVTGGRKTQSALYRVAYVGPPSQPSRDVSQHEQDCEEYARQVREVRRKLEAFHGNTDPAAFDTAWPHLGSPDPQLRHAAQIVLENPTAQSHTWATRGGNPSHPTAVLTLADSLLKAGEVQHAPWIVSQLLPLRAKELDVSQSLQLMHALRRLHEVAPEVSEQHHSQIVRQLEGVLAAHDDPAHWTVGQLGTSAHVRREVLQLLVELGGPQATSRVAELLLDSEDQADRIMGLLILHRVKDGWTPGTRRAYFAALASAPQWIGGEGMPKFVARLRDEAVATLTAEEQRELGDLLAPPAPEPPIELPKRDIVKAWKLDDFASHLADGSRPGDAARGAVVFREAQCVRCHRVGLRGPAVGPDLSQVAGRFSRRDMLQAILLPSAVVAENYQSVQLRLADGRTLLGRVLDEGDYRSQKLRLAVDPLRPGEIVEIDKKEIVESKTSATSPMPGGLLDTFREADVLDLLAFLESTGNADRR